jgi:hypothetical protein
VVKLYITRKGGWLFDFEQFVSSSFFFFFFFFFIASFDDLFLLMLLTRKRGERISY